MKLASYSLVISFLMSLSNSSLNLLGAYLNGRYPSLIGSRCSTIDRLRPDISSYSQAKQSRYSFKRFISSYLYLGSNLALTYVGLGLSPGPISTSSSKSVDVNPCPNFPSVSSIGESIKTYF
jgi:hypothetical protein